jgi:hypothetical protein
MAPVVEYPSSKHEALSSSPNTTEKEKFPWNSFLKKLGFFKKNSREFQKHNHFFHYRSNPKEQLYWSFPLKKIVFLVD